MQVKQLLAAGADANARGGKAPHGNEGVTATWLAARWGRTEVVELLVRLPHTHTHLHALAHPHSLARGPSCNRRGENHTLSHARTHTATLFAKRGIPRPPARAPVGPALT